MPARASSPRDVLSSAERFRRAASRRLPRVLAVSLLLVPLLASGHHHAIERDSATPSCAVCVIASHAPAVVGPAIPQLAPALYAVDFTVGPVLAPALTHRPFKAGRAPPALVAPQAT